MSDERMNLLWKQVKRSDERAAELVANHLPALMASIKSELSELAESLRAVEDYLAERIIEREGGER